MERVMTPEERIRRAEEIYHKRRTQSDGVRVPTNSVNVNTKPNIALFKKMILQILICLLIYFIFYMIQNSNYFFSEEVIAKTKEILSYDINFSEIYMTVTSYLDQFNKNEEQKQEAQLENNIGGAAPEDGSGSKQDQNIMQDTQKQQDQQNEGVGQEETKVDQSQEPEAGEELDQMQIDAKAVKETVSIIKPLEAKVSSRFGMRDPTTPTVPKNHTGIDLAADTGTVIKAAMDGVVTLKSSEGDYGNHIKIENGDVMTLYAHCSKIYVNEGDEIKQGQEIAEVGETGNVTGPHLHFEIRRENRYVNPEYVLDFE